MRKKLLNLNKKYKNSISNINSMRGFSLIELLVSITLFTFVALVAIASLVSTQQLNSRQKAINNLYSNMYFSTEEIARELRQGSGYSNTAGAMQFTPYQPNASSFYKVKYFLNASGAIEKSNNSANSSIFVSEGNLTNDNITITDLKFEIIGGGNFTSDDRQQPSVKIFIKGETKEKPFVKFQLEDFITQRDTDQ